MQLPSSSTVLFAQLTCALFTALSSLSAQSLASSRVHVGLMGGVSVPGGTLQSLTNTGWNAGALVRIEPPNAPLGLRLESQWHQLNGKLQRAGDRPDEYDDFRLIEATANAVYTFPSPSGPKFYFIAGAGVYNERSTVRLGSASTATTATNLGLNAGAGIRFQLSRLATFVELRYHHILHGGDINPYKFYGSGHESMHIFPISIGIEL